MDINFTSIFPVNHPNPWDVPILVSLDEFYNTSQDVNYSLDGDFNDDIENLSETVSYLNAYYQANNLFIFCKACRLLVRSREVQAHLKKKHSWKPLHTQNWKNTQRNQPPCILGDDEEEVVDNRQRRKPGISTQTNSSNYNMKFCKDAKDVKGKIKRKKLFAQFRRRFMQI